MCHFSLSENEKSRETHSVCPGFWLCNRFFSSLNRVQPRPGRRRKIKAVPEKPEKGCKTVERVHETDKSTGYKQVSRGEMNYPAAS